MTRLTKIVALLLLSVAAAEAQPIKIGWSGPLTGNSAVLGIDSVRAAQLAIDEANAGGAGKQKFELLVEDDQYDTAKAVTAYGKLVAQGAAAIIAPTYGGVFATAERAVKDGVLVVDPLDCNEDIAKLPENTFCIATQSESVGRVLAEDIAARKLMPVGILYDQKNPFMSLVEDVIRKSVGAGSFIAGVDQGSTDFKTELLRAKAQGVRSLVFLGHDPMGLAMKRARAIGITAQFYTVGTITSPGFQQLAGPAANGALVAYWEAPRGESFDAFLKRFQEKAGRPPILELATVPTYDAAKILTAAFNTGSGSVKDAKAFLLSVKDHAGVSGSITVDPDGAVRSIRETLYLFENGALKRR